MSRFACPCGLEADVPADEMLDFINRHECAFHKPAPTEPQTPHQAWAGAVNTLIFAALVLGICALCVWGLQR